MSGREGDTGKWENIPKMETCRGGREAGEGGQRKAVIREERRQLCDFPSRQEPPLLWGPACPRSCPRRKIKGKLNAANRTPKGIFFPPTFLGAKLSSCRKLFRVGEFLQRVAGSYKVRTTFEGKGTKFDLKFCF